MYCSNCGAESTFGLKFCKRCGASLGQEAQDQQTTVVHPSRITGAVWAISIAATVITLGGLGIVFDQAWTMIRPETLPAGSGMAPPIGHDLRQIAVILIVFGSLSVFGVVAMLLKLMSRVIASTQNASLSAKESNPASTFSKTAPSVYTPVELPPANRPSVTEHTTRNFEAPRYRDAGAPIDQR